MKTLLLAILAIVLGVALGAGTALFRVRSAPWNPDRDEGVATPAVAAALPTGPAPKAVVDRTEYDFGTVERGVGGSCDFVFTNAGDAPLTLSQGKTSCHCTVSKLDQESVPPGGSLKVTVTWKPDDRPRPAKQTIDVMTNDPARPLVTLTIVGRIMAPTQFLPPELVFSHLSAGESAAAKSRFYCYRQEPLKVLSHKWSDEAMAPYFDAIVEPLSAEEVKKEPLAQSGVLIKVTVKPGLPQGAIAQRLLLDTNVASSPEQSLPILGMIGSEISVAGPGWDSDTGVLTFGEVSRATGAQRKLMLVVRGPLRKEVDFKPASTMPDAIKVTLGPRAKINDGTVVRVPLTIEIPPNSPPGNHLGSQQGELGQVILETTHPRVPTLRIFVRFAIEG